jgi:hypothetical protein
LFVEISSSRIVVSDRVASAVSVMLTREEMLKIADILEASFRVDESSVREVRTLREKHTDGSAGWGGGQGTGSANMHHLCTSSARLYLQRKAL